MTNELRVDLEAALLGLPPASLKAFIDTAAIKAMHQADEPTEPLWHAWALVCHDASVRTRVDDEVWTDGQDHVAQLERALAGLDRPTLFGFMRSLRNSAERHEGDPTGAVFASFALVVFAEWERRD